MYLINGMEVGRFPRYQLTTFPRKISRTLKNLLSLSVLSWIRQELDLLKRTPVLFLCSRQRWFWAMDPTGRLCLTPEMRIAKMDKTYTSIIASNLSTHLRRSGGQLAFLGLIWLFVASRYLTGRIFIFDVNRNLVEADLFIVQTENKKIA